MELAWFRFKWKIMDWKSMKFQTVSLIKLLKGKYLTYIDTEGIAKQQITPVETPHQLRLPRTFIPYGEELVE